MDIGAEFDDDFFEKPKEKQLSKPLDYEAKIFVPLWYMKTEMAENESADVLVALKHKADFYYYSSDFAKAAETYEQCLELVPPANNTWKREFMENLSRSLLHLGNAEKALEWSLKLYEASFSADQKVVSMNLLATVCHKLGKYKEELEALHCCIEAHKSCPEFWLRLGLCYAGLFKIDLPDYSILKSVMDSEPCCAFNSKLTSSSECSETVTKDVPYDSKAASAENAVPSSSTSASADPCSTNDDITKCEICTLGIQIVSSCLIHTRVLLDSSGPNLLGLERDKRIKEKIENSLKHMEVDQSFIEVASKMLGTDFLAGFQEARDSQTSSFPATLNSD
ncbi:hypothetical protein X975_21053, partial [Stegodyphus mimosarum]